MLGKIKKINGTTFFTISNDDNKENSYISR